MQDNLKDTISRITDDKLTSNQIEELESFFRQLLSNNLDNDEETFFRGLAYEMTGDLKDLALLLIDFKKDIKAKIYPEITELAMNHIPQATDQLECIIETTEMAAHKIMDNLENMQGHAEKMDQIFAALKEGKVELPGEKKGRINGQAIETIYPLVDYMKSGIQNYNSLISDSFVQMSFQDLTGQRIRRIITLVSQMEEKLKKMIVSFGIKLTEREKNPDVSYEELQKTVDDKVSALAGPQMEGQGLGQTDIDDLLSNL